MDNDKEPIYVDPKWGPILHSYQKQGFFELDTQDILSSNTANTTEKLGAYRDVTRAVMALVPLNENTLQTSLKTTILVVESQDLASSTLNPVTEQTVRDLATALRQQDLKSVLGAYAECTTQMLQNGSVVPASVRLQMMASAALAKDCVVN